MALGVVSSIDMLPCSSGEGCCLFSHGDCLGTVVGEAAMGDCSSAGGAWQVEQMEVTEVIAPTRHGRRWPDSP